MADQSSMGKILSNLKRFNTTLNHRLSLKVWFDDKDEDKGIPLPIKNIGTFHLRESMFLKLPVGNFTYTDDGTFKNSNVLRPGRIMYIGFEYKAMATDSNKSNISVGRFRIENVKIINNAKQNIAYSISFIYDALKFLNSIPRFPNGDGAAMSTDAMSEVCADAGIDFSTGVDTSDLMYWFNPSMRTCDFVTLLVNHSYISDSDFGMFWINKNGEGKFDGMKNRIENGVPYFFKDEKDKNKGFTSKHLIFNDTFNKDATEMSNEDLKLKYGNACWILFYGDQRNNDSWENMLFGNSVEVNMYDPYLKTIEYPGEDMTLDGYSVTHTVTAKPIQSGQSANDSTMSHDVQNHVTKGYVNPDLHNFWDIAPEQNKVMRSQFFANRHTITLNTGKQLDCFAQQDLKIGDPIEIDFTRPFDKVTSPDSGKYIIHTIDWYFEKDTDLEIQLRVASDVVHPVKQV